RRRPRPKCSRSSADPCPPPPGRSPPAIPRSTIPSREGAGRCDRRRPVGRPQSRFIAAGVHGRYLMDAPAGPGPHPLLVVFHGYKENAEAHLEQLQRVPGAARFVLVAVQSLHLFYSKSGDVVGSWMTRLGREHAIEDNVRYVGAVVAEVKRHLPAAGGLVYAGFSQGASMAYRAAA